MKLQLPNRSFGKGLAAVAVAFMISSAVPARAEQGQWGSDGCFYKLEGRQQGRQGCAFQRAGGRRFYRDDSTKVWTDLDAGLSFFFAQDGRSWVYTRTGWIDAAKLLHEPGCVFPPNRPNRYENHTALPVEDDVTLAVKKLAIHSQNMRVKADRYPY